MFGEHKNYTVISAHCFINPVPVQKTVVIYRDNSLCLGDDLLIEKNVHVLLPG
jgi:hypothetical protein